ncbi:MAG: T9SS type A sorting domain-containing protein, partial [Bacteroidales bacterium]|nr:T9SS type A sorting domain-containing protein [Bacteroidales bacterium]
QAGIIILSCITVRLSAQCTPVPHSSDGIFPEEGFVLNPAAATDYWSLNVTVIVPQDTVIPPLPAVPIDSATIKTFIGFPASFFWEYNTASGYWAGNTAGCMRIQGVPVMADIGIYSIDIVFEAVISSYVYKDTMFNYWTFEIKDDGHVGLTTINSEDDRFTITPNPAQSEVIINSSASIIGYEVFDITGSSIYAEAVILSENKILLITNHLRPGVYLVKANTAKGVISRKFIISS